MKRLLVLLSFVFALVIAWPAAADRGDRRGAQDQDRRSVQRDDRDRGRDSRDSNRNYDDRRSQRRDYLSPDERRELRRDIQDAGRDVYRERRPRR
jgi:hypothetical protein